MHTELRKKALHKLAGYGRKLAGPAWTNLSGYASDASGQILNDAEKRMNISRAELISYPWDWEYLGKLKEEGYFPNGESLSLYAKDDFGMPGGGYSPDHTTCRSQTPAPTIFLQTNGLGQVSRSVAAHEAGHGKDYRRLHEAGKIDPSARSKGRAFMRIYGVQDVADPVQDIGASRMPLPDYLKKGTGRYRMEQNAWDQASGKCDSKIREMALKSYENMDRLGWYMDYVNEIERPFKNRGLSIVPEFVSTSGHRAAPETVKKYVDTHTSDQAVEHIRRLSRRDDHPFDYQYNRSPAAK